MLLLRLNYLTIVYPFFFVPSENFVNFLQFLGLKVFAQWINFRDLWVLVIVKARFLVNVRSQSAPAKLKHHLFFCRESCI